MLPQAVSAAPAAMTAAAVVKLFRRIISVLSGG